jgi:hypothetical protein
MNLRVSIYDLLHTTILRAASLIVPTSQRAEWHQEWRGELWHVRQACAPAGHHDSGQAQHQVTAFCMGAFPDALCVRRAGTASPPAAAGTPRQCLFVLSAILAATYAVALLLPGVRAERNLWPRHVSPNLVLIQEAASDDSSRPTISPRLFRTWQTQRQRFFDEFAFFRVANETMKRTIAPHNPQHDVSQPWQPAHASANIFDLLGLPVQFAEPELTSDAVPAVVLSERTWKRDFAADPHVAGLIIQLGQQTLRIAGVAPDGSLSLPGNVDAWELDPAADRASPAPGFVVARLTAPAKPLVGAQTVHIQSDQPASEDEDLLGISLEHSQPATRTVYLFALLLALLSLPAITSVSLGEASAHPHQASWTNRLLRWSFFSAKVALLLPIIYFVSMNLAYGFTILSREQSIYIQLAATFGMCLFSLRWALKDQRQRCPVCMRLVTHPAQVGQASRTFLDWNGTEMMCMGGHTLLHVPSLPTSWFGAQRWLYLDTSWDFLFAAPTRPIP